MNVIILAAGFGSRLKELTKEKGKALVELKDKPLIDYALRFTDNEKVEKRVIVGGFTFDKLKAHIDKSCPEKTVLLENKQYDKGSILTLLTAKDYLTTDFLLMNVDHVYAPEMFDKITKNISGITAVIDSARDIVEDDMKVKLDKNKLIVGIDKRLTDYDAGYIGMTLVSADSLPTYLSAVDAVLTIKGEGAVVEPILQYLSEKGTAINTVDIAGLPWCEMNTQEEREYALQMLDTHKDRFKKYFI